MRQRIGFILLLLSCTIGFAAYCVSVIDWVQDVKTGVYTHNRLEGVLETTAQLVYLYFAFRFMRNRIDLP